MRRPALAAGAALLFLACGAGLEERLAGAERAFADRKWSQAEAGYRRVLKEDPAHFQAHLRMAEIYFEKKRYDIMLGYHLREAERIMKAGNDPKQKEEFRRVRDRIVGKALEGGRI